MKKTEDEPRKNFRRLNMVIGLIGGIGSGKSVVSSYLEDRYDFKLLRADDIAKEMEKPGHQIYYKLTEAFGEGILVKKESFSEVKVPDKPGEKETESLKERPIDKETFSRIIYTDKEALKKANDIIHPYVWQYIGSRISAHGRFVIETALPDKKFPAMCDTVWYICADKKIRLERLVTYRFLSEEKITNIMGNQLEDEEFRVLSDEVILNNGRRDDLLHKVDELIRLLPENAGIRNFF